VVRGEITILIAKAEEVEQSDVPLEDAVRELESTGLSRMDAIKQVAKARGISKRDCYRQLNIG
jgi:16S rRNA C1402 (ribose-2'-O) methylase RsmI